MVPFAYLCGDTGSTNPVCMSATNNELFAQNIDANQEPVLATMPCPTGGTAHCQVFKYSDHFKNFCQTTQQQTVLTALGLPTPQASDEHAFMHLSGTNPTPEPAASPVRLVSSASGATCSSYYTVVPTPGADTHPFMMNPGDSGYQTTLQTNVWNTSSPTNFPTPYQDYEDNSEMMGNGVTGGVSARFIAEEYGCGLNGGNTCANNLVGTLTWNQGIAWGTAVGQWVNAACQTLCLSLTLNGGTPLGGSSLSCSVITAGVCNDPFFTGDINNTFNAMWKQTVVANTSGNLKYFDDESPVFSHVTDVWSGPAMLAATENSYLQMIADSTENGLKQTHLEPTWGVHGPGGSDWQTVGVQVRTMATAMDWMAADCSSTAAANDRIIPRWLPSGGTQTEGPAFFENFLVTFGCEQTVAPYVWNGSTVTLGTGCASDGSGHDADFAAGHGIIDLLKSCGSDGGGVYVRQFSQLWFNHHLYGPVAVVVNMSSSTTFTLQSSWFTGDAIGTYHFTLSLAPGELTSIAQGNAGGGTATFGECTNMTFCIGANTVAGNSAAWSSVNPGTVPPHSAVILIASNS